MKINPIIDLFFKCLATCHSVISHNNPKDTLEYFASSLDELAILNGCRYLKYIFKEINKNEEINLEIKNENFSFKLLQTFEFTSVRKRMSVIIKEKETDKIYLFMKGADDILRDLSNNLDYFNENFEQNKNYSSQGLRTLNVAYKEIDLFEYKKFEEFFEVKIYF